MARKGSLLDLAGFSLFPKQHLDGKSFKAILLDGGNKKVDREALYWHYPHGVFQGAVRWKNNKLVYHYKTGRAELYDLVNDPGERNDISAENPRTTNKMKKILSKWLLKSGARFPAEGVVLP